MKTEDQILIWDWPVRLGHWLMALSFLVAWSTRESEEWRLVHAYAGNTVLAIVLFRLLWGWVGSRYARFSSFVAAPGRVWLYLKSVLSGRAEHWVGHNPAGGYAILGLLSLALTAGVSGWLAYQDLGGEWLKEFHGAIARLMLALVLVHLAGVVVGSLAHRENLVHTMLTGKKRGEPEDAIPKSRPLTALLLLTWIVVVAPWLTR